MLFISQVVLKSVFWNDNCSSCFLHVFRSQILYASACSCCAVRWNKYLFSSYYKCCACEPSLEIAAHRLRNRISRSSNRGPRSENRCSRFINRGARCRNLGSRSRPHTRRRRRLRRWILYNSIRTAGCTDLDSWPHSWLRGSLDGSFCRAIPLFQSKYSK